MRKSKIFLSPSPPGEVQYLQEIKVCIGLPQMLWTWELHICYLIIKNGSMTDFREAELPDNNEIFTQNVLSSCCSFWLMPQFVMPLYLSSYIEEQSLFILSKNLNIYDSLAYHLGNKAFLLFWDTCESLLQNFVFEKRFWIKLKFHHQSCLEHGSFQKCNFCY